MAGIRDRCPLRAGIGRRAPSTDPSPANLGGLGGTGPGGTLCKAVPHGWDLGFFINSEDNTIRWFDNRGWQGGGCRKGGTAAWDKPVAGTGPADSRSTDYRRRLSPANRDTRGCRRREPRTGGKGIGGEDLLDASSARPFAKPTNPARATHLWCFSMHMMAG